MIITSLDGTFTWYGIRWDIHAVMESTNCSKCVSKMQFKRCPIMSRPLQLYTSENLHVFHDDDCPHFPMEGSVKLSTMALIRLSWGGHVVGGREYMTNCCMRKGPSTGGCSISWCRMHFSCIFDWFQGLVSCVCDVCITAPVRSSGGGVVPSEGSRFSIFSHCHAS